MSYFEPMENDNGDLHLKSRRGIKNKILELRKNNKTYNEICVILNCAKSTVSYHCERNDLLELGKKHKDISDETIADIKKLTKEMTVMQVAAKLNLGRTTVKKYKDKFAR